MVSFDVSGSVWYDAMEWVHYCLIRWEGFGVVSFDEKVQCRSPFSPVLVQYILRKTLKDFFVQKKSSKVICLVFSNQLKI